MNIKISSKKNGFCRICLNKKLKTYLNLGIHPPSNSFIKKKDFKFEKKFPLVVQLCENCGLSQLNTTVLSKEIFDEYLYLSSTSKALVQHYYNMVNKILKICYPNKSSLIIDIGSNDGITLKSYPKNKFNLLGIEPSSASNYAIKAGINTEKEFFSYDFSQFIKKKYGKATIITATNVFAHVDKIRDFTKGIKNILKNNGVFVVEFPYLKYMLDHKFFDIIYHEHLSYLSIKPLMRLFKEYMLKIFDIEEINLGASGPALRIYVTHENSKEFKTKTMVDEFIKKEEKGNFQKIKTYKKFSKEVFKIRDEIDNLIKKLYEKNFKIGAFGAPAKGNTMLNFLKNGKINIVAVADNTPIKINKFTPGTHIPIVSDEKFNLMNIDYALLLSWNYLDFFLKNSEFIRKGGKFIIPFPIPRIIPNEKN